MRMEEPVRQERIGICALIAIALLASFSASGDSASPMSPEELSATIKTMPSDAFQEPAPGTAGDAVTLEYLVDRFAIAARGTDRRAYGSIT